MKTAEQEIAQLLEPFWGEYGAATMSGENFRVFFDVYNFDYRSSSLSNWQQSIQLLFHFPYK